MPENFVQTIDVTHFKLSSLRVCLICNGCPYHVHSEGVRQRYPIFFNCHIEYVQICIPRCVYHSAIYLS